MARFAKDQFRKLVQKRQVYSTLLRSYVNKWIYGLNIVLPGQVRIFINAPKKNKLTNSLIWPHLLCVPISLI